jgi:putative salt-induced outer membrane protein YdiY
MFGGCCRLWWCVSVTLMFLLAIGFAAGSLWAQEPPPADEAEDAAEESSAAADTTGETGAEAEPEAGAEPEPEAEPEAAVPVPPFIKAVEKEGWGPLTPLPEKFDWIQLKSDEWLKGEFIALYNEKLEFDSDELDLLELDWKDVKQVRTSQVMDVGFLQKGKAIDIGLLHNNKATGKLWIEGDTVRVINDEEVIELERFQIVTITTGAQSEFKKWAGKVSLGLSVQQGNTEQTDVNNMMNFKRRTIENRLNFDWVVNFSQVRGIDTINNQRANVNWDKFLTNRFFINPTIFEWYRDPFKNISSRTTFSIGAGYQIVDTKRTEWDVSGGPGYQETHFDSVQAGDDDETSTGSLGIETNFDQDWTKDIEFKYTYRAQFTNTASGKYNHHMVMTFETEWTKVLDFDFSVIWDRTEKPQQAADGTVPEQDDLRMVVGLGIEF